VQYPYIKNIGLDIRAPKFIHIEPNDFEEGALHIVESLIRIKPSLIIIDSLTAMMPKAMIEKEADEAGAIGQHARLTSVFLNKITKFLVKSNTALLVINQKRNAIKGQYEEGPKTTTSGGNAMRFYATIRINMKVKSRTEITEMNALTGVKEKKKVDQEVKIIIEKNKSDIPWKSASIWIKFGKGIDNVMSIVKLASATGVIKSSGAGWSEYVDKEKPQYSFKVQGDVGVWTKLSENPEILESVYSKLVFDVDQEEKSSAAEDPELELSDEDAELLADMRTSLGVDKKPKLESIEDSLE
jgi:recombination protein RecA